MDVRARPVSKIISMLCKKKSFCLLDVVRAWRLIFGIVIWVRCSPGGLSSLISHDVKQR